MSVDMGPFEQAEAPATLREVAERLGLSGAGMASGDTWWMSGELEALAVPAAGRRLVASARASVKGGTLGSDAWWLVRLDSEVEVALASWVAPDASESLRMLFPPRLRPVVRQQASRIADARPRSSPQSPQPIWGRVQRLAPERPGDLLGRDVHSSRSSTESRPMTIMLLC